LCLVFLVIAIGLVLATPLAGSTDDNIIRDLRDSKVDEAEVFYRKALALAHPDYGFHEGGFWSVQALTLSSVYELCMSQRNKAYLTFGEAISVLITQDLDSDQ
jgi:hypothetical protein